MDHGPARNLDVMVSLQKIELIHRKSELKNPAKQRLESWFYILSNPPHDTFFGQIFQGVWKQPHLRLWD